MKQIIFSFVAVTLLASCGDGNNTDTNTGSIEPTESSSTFEPNKTSPDYVAGLALVKKSDCLSCHHETKMLIGPSYRDIAARFATHDTTIQLLATKIIKGSKGEWGTTEMTPHPTLSNADAVQMAKYIMVQKAP